MFETHYDEILQLLLHYLASGKEKKAQVHKRTKRSILIIISLLAYNLYIHCVTVYENVGIFHKVSITLQHHVEILLWYIFAICSYLLLCCKTNLQLCGMAKIK